MTSLEILTDEHLPSSICLLLSTFQFRSKSAASAERQTPQSVVIARSAASWRRQ